MTGPAVAKATAPMVSSANVLPSSRMARPVSPVAGHVHARMTEVCKVELFVHLKSQVTTLSWLMNKLQHTFFF